MIPMVGALAINSASQILSSLFSALDPSSSTTSSSGSSASSSGSSDFASACSANASSGTSNALTGSATPQLSGQILMTLMAMQQQSGGASTTAAGAPSSGSSSDPLQQLFSAMDSDGNGSVSQSEMESYIEGQGGTQADADSLYSALSQSGGSSTSATSTTAATSTATTSGVSESQMSSAISQAQQAQQSSGGHHHHHHHSAGGSSNQADSVANTLMQAIDSNDDGSVDESELTNFVTANGGTAADAASDFSALDTSGSGSLTSADFAKAWSNMQAQQVSQSSGSMLVSMLDAFSKAGGAASTGASTVSVSA